MKRLLGLFHRDHDALERAKRADRDADHRLARSRESAAWAKRTLDVNNLTGRFYETLRHGGHL